MPTQNITLDGTVQDVGLRGLIAAIGETRGKRGFVFNEADGTVRIVMAGTRRQATEFVASIEERSADLRADIESVEVTEFDGEIDLPPFGILPTDDLADIGRKLDIGIRSLTGIEEHTGQISAAVAANTGRLSSIEEDTDRLSRIEEHTDRLSGIEEHTDRLSGIEEHTGQISAAVAANTGRLSAIEEDTDRLSGIEEHTGQISVAVAANTDRLSAIEEDTDRLSRIEAYADELVDGQKRMIDLLDERL